MKQHGVRNNAMCGIVGFFSNNFDYDPGNLIKTMTAEIDSRGPDACGFWSSEKKNLFLGHKRLAIQDLSIHGSQPMASPSGRHIIIFNGEIYNHYSIRKKLSKKQPICFRGTSDTETIAACLDIYTFSETIRLLKGMFALAVWDKLEKTLYLARDRFGEKPLYYGWNNKTFFFGSELKALKIHPVFEKKINKKAAKIFLEIGFIPAPMSIYRGIKKVPAGSFVQLFLGERKYFQVDEKVEKYWDPREFQNTQNSFKKNFEKATFELDRLLNEKINDYMISDVEVGSFLSGGIDSALVTSIIKKNTSKNIKTFNIGFNEKDFNEAGAARSVAKYLGTEHFEFLFTSSDALTIIPQIPKIYCEPFADLSQLPTLFLSKMASKHVKVVCSGDGGDEMFGGYNRHIASSAIFRFNQLAPKFVQDLLMRFLKHNFSNNLLLKSYKASSGLFSFNNRVPQLDDKIQKLTNVIGKNNILDYYDGLLNCYPNDEHTEFPKFLSSEYNFLKNSNLGLEHSIMLMDAMIYLTDNILVKVDRATMANSLECRAPLLDIDVANFAWALPIEYKIDKKAGKLILREVLNNYIPNNLITKPKSGFSVPISFWLRGPLREWAEELLNEEQHNFDGIVEHLEISKIWNDFINGKNQSYQKIWNILILAAWMKNE